MQDGFGGEGNRIAHRDYYEIERIERVEIAAFPCASCESRLVEASGEVCRLCRQQAAEERRKAQGAQAIVIWLGLSLFIWQAGAKLFGATGLTALFVSCMLGMGAYFGLHWAAWRLEYWLQHKRE